jgi:hypothetical protein
MHDFFFGQYQTKTAYFVILNYGRILLLFDKSYNASFIFEIQFTRNAVFRLEIVLG